MLNNSRQELRNLVNRQAQTLIEEAVRSGGTVPQDQLDALGKLKRLADLPDPEPRGGRWVLPIVMFVTLVMMSVLLFTHKSSTEIEVDVSVSELVFRVPTLQALTEGSDVGTVVAAGLRRIQIPGDDRHPEKTLEASDGGEQSIRIATVSENHRDGSITLAEIQIPAGTVGTVRYAGVPNRFWFGLKSKDLTLRADVQGSILAKAPGAGSQQMEFKVPKPVDLVGGGSEVDLDLTFHDSAQSGLSPQIDVNQLSFVHIDVMDANASVVRRLSTILSGTLYMESLNGEKRELRSGEPLEFERPEGEIRALRLSKDQISLRFHGSVANIWAGSGESRRTLMPTILEWARAQHGVELLWGGSLYIFGIAGGLLRWMKVSV